MIHRLWICEFATDIELAEMCFTVFNYKSLFLKKLAIKKF